VEIDRRTALKVGSASLALSATAAKGGQTAAPPAVLRGGIAPGRALTRTDAQQLLAWIVERCMRHASPGKTALHLGETAAWFDDRAAGLEGFARLLWGVAPAVAGGMRLPELAAFRTGLINGTDPDHPEYWRPLGVASNQTGVEMTAIAVAIREAPEVFLDPLPAIARDRLLAWLATTIDGDFPPNNWRWFRILTLEAIARAGYPVDRAVIEREHALLDSFRIGDGWWRDGKAGGVDYYNAMAFNFYGLLFAHWRSAEEPERAQRLIDDARQFARRFAHWFADDGQQLVYGRSLTYRFAAMGFWALLARVGHPDFSPGQLRELWSRALRWWLDRPIWTTPGVPSIGYAYPDLLEQEFYNSPQSPLWMMKAFWPLALPADHPFWREPADPFRPRGAGYVLKGAPHILSRRDGDPCLLSGVSFEAEMRGIEDKYQKCAYTAKHGLAVEGTRWLHCGCAGDNILAFSEDGRNWCGRTATDSSRLDGDWLVTIWRVPGAEIETRQRFTDWGEQRNHRITATRALHCVATGHAVDGFFPARGLDSLTHDAALARPVAIGTTLWSDIATPAAGFRRTLIASAPNTNITHRHSAVSGLVGRIDVGETLLTTAISWGAGTPPQLDPARFAG
jgi:hypothetical protein